MTVLHTQRVQGTISETVNNKQQFIDAAYRFMKLEPGCGEEAVKKRFKTIVKKIRPDINIDKETKDKYIALGEARRILLGQEAKTENLDSYDK